MGCSVNGVILFSKERTEEELRVIEATLRQIVVAAEDRGRDTFGFLVLERSGRVTVHKRTGRPSAGIDTIPQLINAETRIIINNNRAEPTTEWIQEKTEENIPPFFDGATLVSHNGIIANDRELETELGVKKPCPIDSSVIPLLLTKEWHGGLKELHSVLKRLVGSYAVAIARAANPDELFFAVNYKPMYIQYHKRHHALYFTSLEEYLTLKSILDTEQKAMQLAAYSTMRITVDGNIQVVNDERTKRRSLCVCSGGLDSTVAATYAKKILCREIALVHFKYHCRAERREVEAVEKIAKRLDCPVFWIPLDVFRDVIRHSRLTNPEEEISTQRDGEAGAEFATEWVPARNLIMLAIVTGLAEAEGFDSIILGNNLEESGAFPDNEMIFVKKLNEVLPYAVNVNKHVEIEMPVGNLMKHEIVKLGLDLNAPLDATWSCYDAGDTHCGVCGPCYMRRNAFKMNDAIDPVQYAKG